MQENKKVKHILTGLPTPLREEEFIGRQQDLERLEKALEESTRVVLVNGMGGIGKTTLATAYAQLHKADFQHVAWLEITEGITTSILSDAVLTINLGLSLTGDAEQDVKMIFNELNNLPGPSLLIIDNADEELSSYRKYLPQSPWQVLITSRENLNFAQKVALDILTPEAARELFYTHYHLDRNDTILEEILETVEYHTLTIELLAKIAQDCNIQPLHKIKKLLQERGLAIGRQVSITAAHSGDERIEYLFPYLQAIFELGDDYTESQIQLLQRFVGLPPIPIETTFLLGLLVDNQVYEEASDQVRVDLRTLARKGLLIHDQVNNTYKIHRVIQEVVRLEYVANYEVLEGLINVVMELLSIDQTLDNPISKFPIVPYAEHLLALNNIDQTTPEYAQLQNNLASVYRHLGRYDEAAELLQQALQSDLNNFGQDHPNVARRQSNLALVYMDLGRYGEATELLEQVLQADLTHFGQDHPNVARRQSNLALVYKSLGRYEEAAELLEQALQYAIIHFGQDHPSVAIRQSNLASVYQDLGRYAEAAELLEQALQSAITHFGQDHPDVAVRQSNLATVYEALGRYAEAAELLQQALQYAIIHFGQDHPNVAVRQSNLASVYQDLGRYAEAAEMLEQTLQCAITHFGQDHPDVPLRQSNLANVYRHLGRYAEAAELLEQALESDLTNFGPAHPAVAVRQSNLALVYKDLGRYELAAKLLEQALES
ncbi:MAG: tetratricopeptide repeat protein, partial [Bacteroidota bacterium]